MLDEILFSKEFEYVQRRLPLLEQTWQLMIANHAMLLNTEIGSNNYKRAVDFVILRLKEQLSKDNLEYME